MAEEATQLQADALGTTESVVMGVAGTAPAFSAAATTATLIAGVGTLSAGSIFYCGIAMLGVTLAFMSLNRVITNAGASYAWVGEVFGPAFGFFAGWSLLVASTVFMVSGSMPAATATLLLVSPDRVNDPATVSFVAAGWLVAVSMVIVKGIKPTSYTQVVMTVVEVGVLALVIVLSFVKFWDHPAHEFGWRWFSLGEFSPTLFATGQLAALFFFFGWDVTLNLNEETRDAAHAPGKGAVIAMVIVVLMFIGFVSACELVLTDAEIAQSATNVVFAMAEKLLPRPWSYLAVIAVVLSTIGTLETSILQFTRTMYAKGRDGALHPRYAILHASWKTPWVATAVIVVLGLALLFLSSFIPTVGEILKVSVDAIAFQIACYYILACLACVWRFRSEALGSRRDTALLLVWPSLSAAFLLFIVYYGVRTFDTLTAVIGIGGIAIGVVPLLLNRRRAQQDGGISG